jgi:hypothetical protein
MSHDYALSRVRDALEKSGGDPQKAQRMILSWLEKDHTLLVGLAAPHVQGIVAHAVGHAALPQSKKLPKQVEVDKRAAPADPESPRPKASQKHVDAINAIVKAGKNSSGKKS